jgi:hypothetical protein
MINHLKLVMLNMLSNEKHLNEIISLKEGDYSNLFTVKEQHCSVQKMKILSLTLLILVIKVRLIVTIRHNVILPFLSHFL